MIRFALLAALSLTPAAVLAQQTAPTEQSAGQSPQNAPPILFAKVNDTPIPAAEFDRTARETFRQKFYHGQPPEAEVQAMLRGVGQDLIDNRLLRDEVERRKINPDMESVQAEISKYEKQYANSENWKKTREQALPGLTAYLSEQSRLETLKRQVRNVAEPSEDEVRAYYNANLDLFTEPEKIRLSQILLKVDPSSPTAAWEAAADAAKTLRAALLAGGSFEAEAKARSGDASAANGGDMGYIHRGMLSEEAHKQIDPLKPGEITEPIRALPGVMLLKLTDRIPPVRKDYASVATRARALMQRERSEAAWQKFLENLRANGRIEIDPRFSAIMSPATAR